MRWQFAVVVLVGGLLGFSVQYAADHPCNLVFVSSSYPPPFPEDGPYTWAYDANGRFLGSPYFTEDGKSAYPGLPEELPKFLAPPSSQKAHWQLLFYQLVFLDWLKNKGEEAARSAEIGALLGAASFLGIKRLQAAKNSQNVATAT